jgi:hypothetical protein
MSYEEAGERQYELVEVYYDDKGAPTGYTECFMGGDTVEEVGRLVKRLARALKMPVITEEEIDGKI